MQPQQCVWCMRRRDMVCWMNFQAITCTCTLYWLKCEYDYKNDQKHLLLLYINVCKPVSTKNTQLFCSCVLPCNFDITLMHTNTFIHLCIGMAGESGEYSNEFTFNDIGITIYVFLLFGEVILTSPQFPWYTQHAHNVCRIWTMFSYGIVSFYCYHIHQWPISWKIHFDTGATQPSADTDH